MPRSPRSREDNAAAATLVAGAAKVQPNAVVASAANLSADQTGAAPRSAGAADWQNQAWYFYDTIGEFRFGCTWKSQCLSRVKLTITEDQPDGSQKVITEGPEVDALNILFGGDAGQSQGMAQMGLHLTVPGETWLVGEVVQAPDGGETDQWTIYSNEELKPRGNQTGTGLKVYEIDRGDGVKRTINTDEAIVIRLWRPHPRKWVEADSPSRSSLPILREMEQLAKRTAAQIDSRLAGAGILFMPSEISFGTPGSSAAPGTGGQTQSVQDVDSFMRDLTQAMLTPIGDRGDASAVVPIVVKAPGAYVDKVKHITFATPLDEKGIELRKENVVRLATTSDMPAEVMLGLGDVNHWSAWQIDEAGIKTHIEPDAGLITSGLTEKWLRPAVKAMGKEVNPLRRINYDTSDLRLRPDHSAQAEANYDRMEVGGVALRRETGFDESDAPEGDELTGMVLRKLLSDADPRVRVAAAHALVTGSLVLPPVPPEADDTQGPQSQPRAIEPPADPEGERSLPDPDSVPASGALLAACELLVERATERANNRANNRGRVRRPIPAEKLGAALAGAWDSVPRTAQRLGVDPEWLTSVLDKYTRAVLTEGVSHQPEVLVRLLSTYERQLVTV